MAKRKAASSSSKAAAKAEKNPKPATKTSTAAAAAHPERTDPRHRGIRTDALRAGRAPTGAAACVACDRSIPKASPRWGLTYAGNPLPIPVVPLYGSHPMVLWYHAGCGLAYVRYSDLAGEPPAVRTCHACQDAPDDAPTNDEVCDIRLVCGGPPKGRKIRHHAFHIACWIRAIQATSSKDDSLFQALLVNPEDIGPRKTKSSSWLAWNDLTPSERSGVCEEFRRM